MKKRLNFYFDFTSPYSYLSMLQINDGILDAKYEIDYCPVMVGRLFSLNEMSAPAQVKNKALYLYKEALRAADSLGVKLTFPRTLPFNSLPYLRMALGLESNRELQRSFIVETFKYGWQEGFDYEDYDHFKDYIIKNCLTLEKFDELEQDRVLKKELKAKINEAFERGVFGVPTFGINDDFYWGNHNLADLAKNDFLDYNNHEQYLEFKKFFKDDK